MPGRPAATTAVPRNDGRARTTPRYDAAMTDHDAALDPFKSSLINGLRAARAAERDVFATLDPTERDAVPPDGGWSAKDDLAHLSAWRRRQADKMTAIIDGQPESQLPADGIDATNAIFHGERSGWSWDQVDRDADATSDALATAVQAATAEMLADPKIVGSIMGDGPQHDLEHLARVSAGTGQEDRVLQLADETRAMLDDGSWPAGPAAYARYNLACFHALGGRLDAARSLLSEALPGQDELRALAPNDDDLIALRDELPSLAAG